VLVEGMGHAFRIPHAQSNPLHLSMCDFGASRPLKGIFHLEWPQCSGPLLALSCSHSGPLSPLEAAGALVHTHKTVYNITSKHGLHTTFASRLHLDSCTFLLLVLSAICIPRIQVAAMYIPASLYTPLLTGTHPSLLTTHKYHFLTGLTFPLSLHLRSPSSSHPCGC